MAVRRPRLREVIEQHAAEQFILLEDVARGEALAMPRRTKSHRFANHRRVDAEVFVGVLEMPRDPVDDEWQAIDHVIGRRSLWLRRVILENRGEPGACELAPCIAKPVGQLPCHCTLRFGRLQPWSTHHPASANYTTE